MANEQEKLNLLLRIMKYIEKIEENAPGPDGKEFNILDHLVDNKKQSQAILAAFKENLTKWGKDKTVPSEAEYNKFVKPLVNLLATYIFSEEDPTTNGWSLLKFVESESDEWDLESTALASELKSVPDVYLKIQQIKNAIKHLEEQGELSGNDQWLALSQQFHEKAWSVSDLTQLEKEYEECAKPVVVFMASYCPRRECGRYSSLMHATYYNQKELVQELLSVPNVNINYGYAESALSLAFLRGNVELVKRLLKVFSLDLKKPCRLVYRFSGASFNSHSKEEDLIEIDVMLQDRLMNDDFRHFQTLNICGYLSGTSESTQKPLITSLNTTNKNKSLMIPRHVTQLVQKYTLT